MLKVIAIQVPGLTWVIIENAGSIPLDSSAFTIVVHGGVAVAVMGIPLATFLNLTVGFVAATAIFVGVAPSIPPFIAAIMSSYYMNEASNRFRNVYNRELRPLTRSTQTPSSEVVDNNTTEENVSTLIDRGTTLASDIRNRDIEIYREHLSLEEEENEEDNNGSDTDSINSSNDSNISNFSSDPISSSEGSLSSPETVNVFDQYEVLRK